MVSIVYLLTTDISVRAGRDKQHFSLEIKYLMGTRFFVNRTHWQTLSQPKDIRRSMIARAHNLIIWLMSVGAECESPLKCINKTVMRAILACIRNYMNLRHSVSTITETNRAAYISHRSNCPKKNSRFYFNYTFWDVEEKTLNEGLRKQKGK